LRQIDWVPRSVRQKTREIESTISSLEAQLGRTASDQEIAGALGVSEDEYLKTIQKISGTSILSLNDVWFSGDEKDRVSIVDSIESPSSLNPDVMVEKEVMRQVIITAINELPDKEKKILILYCYEDLTLKDIGRVLEVTESRVSQLHTKAILHLRSKLTNIRKGIV
jgi:RNA polymerase sigma factor for flagellar operon FliA